MSLRIVKVPVLPRFVQLTETEYQRSISPSGPRSPFGLALIPSSRKFQPVIRGIFSPFLRQKSQITTCSVLGVMNVTAAAPPPTPPPQGTEFPAAEPGKLTAEFALAGARSGFPIAEFPSLTPATPFLTAEFDFPIRQVAPRPAKRISGCRDPFSGSENPFAECRIRFPDRRNPSADSERQFLIRRPNSGPKESLRSLRKPLGALKKPNSAHVLPTPPVTPRLLRVA